MQSSYFCFNFRSLKEESCCVIVYKREEKYAFKLFTLLNKQIVSTVILGKEN